MFRSLKDTLERKQENLNTQSSVSVVVRQVVQNYIHENYPDAVLRVGVRYHTEEKLLVISTPSKVLAGELTMNAREIRAYLTAHNVHVNRIIAQ